MTAGLVDVKNTAISLNDINGWTCVGIFDLSYSWVELDIEAIRESHGNTGVAISHWTTHTVSHYHTITGGII